MAERIKIPKIVSSDCTATSPLREDWYPKNWRMSPAIAPPIANETF